MSGRHRTEVETTPASAERGHPPVLARQHPGLLQRRALPMSLAEAEERYAAARDEWTAAMQQASSGRPADLAALAMAQEVYESALVELNRWRSGERVSVEVQPEERSLDAIVGQELAWRRVHEAESRRRPGLLARLARRLTRRD